MVSPITNSSSRERWSGFDIDGITGPEPAEGRDSERLGGDVRTKRIRPAFGRGQANAVDGDARTRLERRHRDALQADRQLAVTPASRDAANRSFTSYDAREHS